MNEPAKLDPKELLECALHLPAVVAEACAALPPGVIVLNILEAMRELAGKIEQIA